jgi:predicted methyltransferase
MSVSVYRFHSDARISCVKEEFGSGRNIVYLDDLSHATIASKSGPKRFDESNKKLSRILKEGGTVVINVDRCDPKQLLTFNSVESGGADATLHGIGNGPISVHPECKFVFVGETINKQQLDFKSRGNWATQKQLSSLIGKIEPVTYRPPKVIIDDSCSIQTITENFAEVDVQNRPPEEWKGWLKQGVIKDSNAQYPHMVALQGKTTLVLRGVSPGFNDSGIPDSLAKFLSKRGITTVVIVKDTQPKEQKAVPFDSIKTTVFADKETLFQLLNSPVVGTDGRLSVGNALSKFTNPLQLVITESLAPKDWYQLRQLPNNIIVYKGKNVDGPADFNTADVANSCANNSTASSKDTLPLLVMVDQEYIQSDEVTPKKVSDPSKKSQNKLSSQQSDEDSELDEITPTLLGQFDQKPHGLVSKMKSGETIVVYVPDAKNPPESLRPLLGASPWAILNGELTLLTGRVVLKSSSNLPAKTAKENKPANASDVTDLRSHGESYLTWVQSQLSNHRYVAVHGDAACGKSHLSRQLKNTCFLGDIGQSTNANDIQADPAFKQWLEQGKAQPSVLVIDEYNLAETGVFDCLKGTHINLNGELIQLTDNHKVLFLGNKATETGRNNHPNLIDSIVTMQSPKPEWVVDYCSSIDISKELKDQLIEKVEAGASIRDIQTFFAMYQLNQETAHAMVFTPKISVTELKPTVKNFLDYVDQKPMGNRVLYITGEPGCGKDHSIKEALGEKNIQYECVTLGQHMDIDQFKKMFDTAYANGTVLVVSELSAAPSAVLEYMNDKLAKKADNKFCLIATDNAGFEGREPLSGPLRSRCVCKTIQPVTRDEFDKLFKTMYSEALVKFHFSLDPGTVSLRQLHRAGQLMETPNKRELVDVIREVYGETLANKFINAQKQPQGGFSGVMSSSGTQPQGGSSGLFGRLFANDPATRDLYAESNQPIDQPSIAGTCDGVSNGFLITSVYDDSGKKVTSIAPFIASSDNSPPKKATITSGTQNIAYSVVNQKEPVNSDGQSLEFLLNLNIQNRDEYAKEVAGFIRTHYTYSVDGQTTNSVKKVLEKLTNSTNQEDFVSHLSSVDSLSCDTATLLFIKIMKRKFSDFDIYYGLGFRIIHGKVSGTRHAQPIWETNGVTTTIDPTPVNCNEDKVTQKFREERDRLFNQPQVSVRQQPQGGVRQQPQRVSRGLFGRLFGNSQQQPQGSSQQPSQGGVRQQPQRFSRGLLGRLFGNSQQQPQGSSQQPSQGSVRQQPQGGFSGVIPSSDAQPQGSDRQQTQESKKKAKSQWEEALDKALEESKKTSSRPKVVNAASASLNIDETIRQGILVFGGKRLSEQDKYSLELKLLKRAYFARVFEGASDELKSNKKFMVKAVCIKPLILEYASKELQNDEDVVLAAVKQNGLALGYASEDLRGDKEVVLAAVQKNGEVLRYASEELTGDRELVLKAVCIKPLILEYASKDLRGDREVVLAAVKQDGSALMFASEDLRANKDVVLAAVKQDGSALKYASKDMRANKDVVLAAVQQYGSALKYASEDMRANKNVVLAAVQENDWALKYASEDLRGDKEVILEVVKQYGIALMFASEDLRANKDVVLAAVQKNGEVLKFASNELKNDPDIIAAAKQAIHPAQ